MSKQIDVILFRELRCKVCSNMFSWLGQRNPNFCPECGEILLVLPSMLSKFDVVLIDEMAEVTFSERSS